MRPDVYQNRLLRPRFPEWQIVRTAYKLQCRSTAGSSWFEIRQQMRSHNRLACCFRFPAEPKAPFVLIGGSQCPPQHLLHRESQAAVSCWPLPQKFLLQKISANSTSSLRKRPKSLRKMKSFPTSRRWSTKTSPFRETC